MLFYEFRLALQLHVLGITGLETEYLYCGVLVSSVILANVGIVPRNIRRQIFSNSVSTTIVPLKAI
jgi:hypothetical protein